MVRLFRLTFLLKGGKKQLSDPVITKQFVEVLQFAPRKLQVTFVFR